MVRKLLHKVRGFPVSPTTLGLVGLVLAGFVIRVVSIPFADNYKADAVSRIMIAQNWLAHPHIITSGVWPPLHFYLLALFRRLGHDPWLTSVMLSVVLGSLAVIPIVKFVRIEFDSRRVALLAGILFMLYPLGFQLSLLSMSEVPFIFFLWLSIWLLGEYEARGHRLLYLVAAALVLNAASAIRYESWPLTLLLAVLLIKNKKHALLFVCMGLLFPLTWTFGNWLSTGHALVGLDYSRVLMELSGAPPAQLRTRLAFMPGILVFGLTPLATLMVFWGLCISLKSRRLLRCAVLSVATAAFVAWNVVYQMTLPLDPRYVFTATVFLLPYAALGLDRLIAIVPTRVERYVLPAAIGVSMLLLPYLLAWSGVSGVGGADFRPLPRADSQSRQVIAWLRSHSNADDY